MNTPAITDHLVETYLRAQARSLIPQAAPTVIDDFITAARGSTLWKACWAGLAAVFEAFNFYEDDEDPAAVAAAFNANIQGVTRWPGLNCGCHEGPCDHG